MKETKTKLPELKVQSFVTSLDDEQLLQINGAGTDHLPYTKPCGC